MNKNWNLININKINLKSIKILFLGYGAVAKCVLNYFKYIIIFLCSQIRNNRLYIFCYHLCSHFYSIYNYFAYIVVHIFFELNVFPNHLCSRFI